MTRKPSTKALVPPTLGEDAAERKRVLNVLAQRRYRKRKRERIQALESQSNASKATSSSSTTDSARAEDASAPIPGQSGISNSESHSEGTGVDCSNLWTMLESSEIDPFWSFVNTHSLDSETGTLSLNKQPPTEFPILADQSHDLSEELQTYDTTFFTFPDEHTLKVPSLTLLNAAMRVAEQLKVSDIIWDIAAISPFYQSPSSISSSELSLSVPSLDPISGTSTSEPSPSNSGLQIDLSELPSHLQPTQTQKLIAHHPLLDLLPWPSTRDKLIQVFNLPLHMRPGNAQDPMGLVRLVYDMEDDSGEGITITGQNPFEAGTWEIGQLVFERWWWAFDTGVVEGSNRSRRSRGKERLAINA